MTWTSWVSKFLACVALTVFVHTASAQEPATTTVTLIWDPSASIEVVGYVVYYGAISGEYTNSVTVGTETIASISNLLTDVTYYFAITAINAEGQESGYSNEVSYRHDPLPAELRISDAAAIPGQFTLTVTGSVGHIYEIEATEDFSTWTVIGSVSLDETEALDFTDVNAGEFAQRFYRTRETVL